MKITEFAQKCVQVALNGEELDGLTVQDFAVDCGLIKIVKFDPSKHIDPDGYAEPGDDWFEYTDEFKASLTNKFEAALKEA